MPERGMPTSSCPTSSAASYRDRAPLLRSYAGWVARPAPWNGPAPQIGRSADERPTRPVRACRLIGGRIRPGSRAAGIGTIVAVTTAGLDQARILELVVDRPIAVAAG